MGIIYLWEHQGQICLTGRYKKRAVVICVNSPNKARPEFLFLFPGVSVIFSKSISERIKVCLRLFLYRFKYFFKLAYSRLYSSNSIKSFR